MAPNQTLLAAASRAAGRLRTILRRLLPGLLLAAASGLLLLPQVPRVLRRIAGEYRDRFAPPGTGEAEDTLADHYRFLETLAPRVRPEDRVLAITDRFPYPDLAYWILPPRPGGPVVDRVNPKVERVAAYLRASGSTLDPQEVIRELRERTLRGLLYDEVKFRRFLPQVDVLVALDTELDLRKAAADAGLTTTLLEWSPRKYALARPGGGR